MKPTLDEPLMVLNTKSGLAASDLGDLRPSSLSSGTYSSPTISMPSCLAYCLMILFAVRGNT